MELKVSYIMCQTPPNESDGRNILNLLYNSYGKEREKYGGLPEIELQFCHVLKEKVFQIFRGIHLLLQNRITLCCTTRTFSCQNVIIIIIIIKCILAEKMTTNFLELL